MTIFLLLLFSNVAVRLPFARTSSVGWLEPVVKELHKLFDQSFELTAKGVLS